MSAAFDIDLNDGVSAPAAKAASSVKSLSDQFDQLQRSMASADKITAQVPAGQAKAGDSAAETSKWFSDLQQNADASSEALAGVKQMAGEAAAVLEIGVTILAAYGAALYSLAENAIKFTQEKDALRSTFDVFTGGGGQKLLDELEDLAATLPFTADKLNAWAKSLLAAGIQGDALKESIKAVAAATAIMGEAGGQAAMTLLKRFAMMAEVGQKVTLDRRILSQLAEAGVSVQALAKALGVPVEKLGKMQIGAKELGAAMQKALIQQGAGPLAQLGQTWGSISAKIREGFEDAFEDLGDLVHPFMRELESLASEFFAGSIGANTWKDGVRKALTIVFEVATRTVRAIHIAFLELEIGFLKAKIALKPITKALDSVGISAGIVNVAMYLIGATALILAVIFGVLALAVLLVAAPFIIAAIAIYLLITGIRKLINYVGEATGGLDGFNQSVRDTISNVIASIYDLAAKAPQALADFTMSALAAGGNFVLGLVQALLTGQGPVADAAKALALRAKNAVFGALGISSPSKVMLKAGAFTSEGLAMGIEQGAADVEAAAAGSAGAAVSGASSGLAGGKGGGGGITIGEVTIQVMGGDGKTWQQVTREALALVLEEAALQAGLGGSNA